MYIDNVELRDYNVATSNKKKGSDWVSEKEKREIAEMVKTARHLAEHDPQGFMLAKNSMDILKARSDMEKVEINEREEE